MSKAITPSKKPRKITDCLNLNSLGFNAQAFVLRGFCIQIYDKPISFFALKRCLLGRLIELGVSRVYHKRAIGEWYGKA